ncbi:hypothetical protein E1267_24075 [Nonomuraea longispora]|uniref:Uncharacterized protein n=1 Tax=Nonomuraea longispora TaxID=1848320 RepID=A0A4R4NBT9_9ACTN|nr:hypothetical protein [Nonomuraea longispora]TDC04072.1 hypothetical protein E1267_24075 [Nonomuraea longispora]
MDLDTVEALPVVEVSAEPSKGGVNPARDMDSFRLSERDATRKPAGRTLRPGVLEAREGRRGRGSERGFDEGFARRLPVVGNEQTLLLGPAAHWLIGPRLEYSKEPPPQCRK